MFRYQMPKVTFFLRSNNDHANSFVLYCRVSHNGTTSEISIREKLFPEQWNQGTQKAKTPSKAQTNFINYTVESITYRIKSLFLEKDFRHSTAKQIIQAAFFIEKSEPSILEIVEKWIAAQKQSAPGTLKIYQNRKANFIQYQKKCGAKFLPSTFTATDANKFIEWFKKEKQTDNNTTAVRNILFVKSALQWSLNQGLIENFGISNFTAKKDKNKEPTFIDRKEFEKLFALNCANPYHGRIKDLFLFQCCTGLSYVDLWNWTIEKNFLHGKRNKNGQSFKVPLDQMTIHLIEKYNGSLPRYDNQVYNRVLKEIAHEAGIKKRLTTHVGRKTFATLQDGKGWSKEAIALMLGHRSIKTTETYYIGQSFERLDTELERIKKAPN